MSFSGLIHSQTRAYIAACVSTIYEKITFVKLNGTIQRTIISLIMIFLTTCITTTKSDWVTTEIIQI